MSVRVEIRINKYKWSVFLCQSSTLSLQWSEGCDNNLKYKSLFIYLFVYLLWLQINTKICIFEAQYWGYAKYTGTLFGSGYIDGFVQDCSNSSALAEELLQSWTNYKPSMLYFYALMLISLRILFMTIITLAQMYSISQEICTRFLLCCALLWLYIDWFSHIHQAYFTGTVAI